MVIGEDTIMVFVNITRRTVGTILWMVAVENLANRQNLMRSLDPEQRMVVAIAEGSVMVPTPSNIHIEFHYKYSSELLPLKYLVCSTASFYIYIYIYIFHPLTIHD